MRLVKAKELTCANNCDQSRNLARIKTEAKTDIETETETETGTDSELMLKELSH